MIRRQDTEIFTENSSACGEDGLIDLHTHLLPKMDDGSSGLVESLQMLERMKKQNVRIAAVTPHFYCSDDHPGHFLEKRARRLEELRSYLKADAPVIVAGCELLYYEGITMMDELPEFRYEGSNAILIEMPNGSWTDRMVEDIIAINRRPGFQVVLAHIERYCGDQRKGLLSYINDAGILCQSNASFFTGFRTAKKALKMLENGEIHLLGSDCHNLKSRAPDLGSAVLRIRKEFGDGAVRTLMSRAEQLLLKRDAAVGVQAEEKVR